MRAGGGIEGGPLNLNEEERSTTEDEVCVLGRDYWDCVVGAEISAGPAAAAAHLEHSIYHVQLYFDFFYPFPSSPPPFVSQIRVRPMVIFWLLG